jgi:hypothetical protein
MNRIITYLIISIISFNSTEVFSQRKAIKSKDDSARQYRTTKGTKYGFWFLPTRAKKIHGIAFGLVNDCANHNFQTSLYINGISIEIMGAIPTTVQQLIFPDRNPVCHSNYCRTNGIAAGLSVNAGLLNGIGVSGTVGHLYNLNGIFICPIQHIAQDANGIIIGLMTRTEKTTGLQLGILNKNSEIEGLQVGLWNRSKESTEGVQLGLINSSENLTGVQIGLLNHARNKKIKYMPFINFSFK